MHRINVGQVIFQSVSKHFSIVATQNTNLVVILYPGFMYISENILIDHLRNHWMHRNVQKSLGNGQLRTQKPLL